MNKKTSNRIKMILVIVLSLAFLSFSNETFIFAAAPTVTTDPATFITKSSANLNGSISNDGGKNIILQGFEYGQTSSYGTSVQVEQYTENTSIGSLGGGDGELLSPYRGTVDSSDNIYIADTLNNRIEVFDPLGFYLMQFGTAGSGDGQFNQPIDVAINSGGDIYVSDFANDRIQKFNSSGVYQSQFGTSGTGNGQFNFLPYGGDLDFDSLGNIYVTDSGNSRIQKFNSSGVYQSQFGTFGYSGNLEFDTPSSIFIDGSDLIHIGSSGLLRIFDTSGSFLAVEANLSHFYTNIFFDTTRNHLYGVDQAHNHIEVYSKSFNYSGLSSLTCGTTYHYRAFATNSDGTSYGSDETFDTLSCEPPIVETKSATLVGKTSAFLNALELDDGVSASTVRGFEYGQTTSYGQTITLADTSLSISSINSAGVGGIATDNQGYFYAAVGGDNSVTVSDSSGNFVKKFGWGVETGANQFEICTSGCLGGILGSGNGQFNFTDASGAIAVDYSGGVIYVDDLNGLQKFDLSGNFIEKIPTITSAKDMLVISGTPTYLYTIDGSGIKKYSTDGTFISTLPGGDLSMSLSPDGVIYSVDSSNDHVLYTYPSSGASGVVTFTYPSGFTPIDFPSSITLDPGGNMVIGDVGGEPRIVFATPDSQTKFTVVSAITSTQIFSASGFELTGPVMDMIINVSNRIFLSTLNDGGFSFSPFFFKKLKPISCNTSYHYRAFATNPEGTTYGADQTFTTLACGSSGGGGGPPPPPPVYGCTDPVATNYSSSATADDGSCTYPAGYLGCTDPTADNYNASAIADDGSCVYGGVVSGCTDATANNYNSLATVDDGSCTYGGGGPAFIFGCTDSVATNYNILATSDDGSCTYDGGGTGLIPGCTNPLADNYDPLATSDNGTCTFSTSLPPWVPLPVIDIIHTVTGYIDDHPAVHQAVQILAITGIAVPTSLYLFNEWAGVVSLFLRLWNLIPTIFGLRRKRRPWGTVYDSVTKQPLDPVTVVLRDMFGKDISTSITDLDGRYGFWVPEGTYKITANKGDYLFPSAKMAGKDHDELYDNLYFGGEITVKGEDDIINKNIPMDAINFNWNEFEKGKNKKLMKFYSTRDLFLARIAKILFIAGFVSSCVLAVIEPRTLNYVVLGIYVLIFILSIFGIKPKSAGHVIERATRMPLSFGIMKVFSAGLQTEVNHTVISATGKYYLLVPKGRYYIKLLKKTGEDSYEELFTSKPFTARHGYISKVIKV
jgi:hypothetical protein